MFNTVTVGDRMNLKLKLLVLLKRDNYTCVKIISTWIVYFRVVRCVVPSLGFRRVYKFT